MWLAVEGDLRFLSHHETMRAVERSLLRAGLPLRFTRGFHPHPILSLACPRPVGVASDEDLLVVPLEEPTTSTELLEALTPHAPQGMWFLQAAPLPMGSRPHPQRCWYELTLSPESLETVGNMLVQWQQADRWPVDRHKPARQHRRGKRSRRVDLKALVTNLRLQGRTIRWQQQPQGDLWARPGEVLEMLGLDPQADLARVRRTAVAYQDLPPWGGSTSSNRPTGEGAATRQPDPFADSE